MERLPKGKCWPVARPSLDLVQPPDFWWDFGGFLWSLFQISSLCFVHFLEFCWHFWVDFCEVNLYMFYYVLQVSLHCLRFDGCCKCSVVFAHRLVVLHVLATSFLPWLSSFSGSPNFSVFPSLFFPFAGLFRGSDNCWQHSRHAQSWSGFEMLYVVLVVAVELLLLRQECKAKSSKLERGWGRAQHSVSPRPPQLLCFSSSSSSTSSTSSSSSTSSTSTSSTSSSSTSSSSSWWWCWCWWWWWWRW